MGITRREVTKAVCNRVGERLLHTLIVYIKKQGVELWGMKRSKTFVGDIVLVALYKDLYAKGYHTLQSEVKRWLPMAVRTLEHNIQALRRA